MLNYYFYRHSPYHNSCYNPAIVITIASITTIEITHISKVSHQDLSFLSVYCMNAVEREKGIRLMNRIYVILKGILGKGCVSLNI